MLKSGPYQQVQLSRLAHERIAATAGWPGLALMVDTYDQPPTCAPFCAQQHFVRLCPLAPQTNTQTLQVTTLFYEIIDLPLPEYENLMSFKARCRCICALLPRCSGLQSHCELCCVHAWHGLLPPHHTPTPT
jgi:hypothetical protein